MSDAELGPGSVVAAYLAAGDRGDWDRMQACLSEDVITHSPGGMESVGLEAQRAAWTAAREGLRDLRHEVQSMLVSGEAVAARVVVTGVHVGPFLGIPATGAALRVDQALFARLASRRIAEMWEIVDTGTGLQQLGVLGKRSLSPGG